MTTNEEIINIYKETLQSRSNYQLRNFVLGQHDSPEVQYKQLLMEMHSLITGLEETKLQIEKIEAEIEELQATGKKSDAIEAKLRKLKISEKETHISSMEKELDYLKTVYNNSIQYTPEEIEQAQKAYWDSRLTRVAQLQFLSQQTGVSWAQLEALQQANIIEQAITEIPTLSKIENHMTQLTIDRKDKND